MNEVARDLRERGDRSTVVNAGIVGNRVAHLQQRRQTDVLDHRPATLSIDIGVNDTLAAFFEGRPTPPDAFERRYVNLLDRSAAAGVARLVLMEPAPDDATRPRGVGGPTALRLGRVAAPGLGQRRRQPRPGR
ncbi:MAG: hypothetical protein IRY85_04830 [Micromonosporaceae bacterium]|nr:hypothetical protein [Micromonosporaceae bacterium]